MDYEDGFSITYALYPVMRESITIRLSVIRGKSCIYIKNECVDDLDLSQLEKIEKSGDLFKAFLDIYIDQPESYDIPLEDVKAGKVRFDGLDDWQIKILTLFHPKSDRNFTNVNKNLLMKLSDTAFKAFGEFLDSLEHDDLSAFIVRFNNRSLNADEIEMLCLNKKLNKFFLKSDVNL